MGGEGICDPVGGKRDRQDTSRDAPAATRAGSGARSRPQAALAMRYRRAHGEPGSARQRN